MEYRAIIKRTSNDELRHWKYIKREKAKNGKWRYIYDRDQEVTKYNNESTIISKDPLGDKVITTYRQNNKLFDNETRVSSKQGINVIKTQGKISRAIAKGEKWIFDNFISNEKKYPSQRNPKKKKDNNENNTDKENLKDKIKELISDESKKSPKEKSSSDKTEKKDRKKSLKEQLAELPKKTKEYTAEEDQALINPNYDPNSYEYSHNCSYCTMAYEFRRRGYDVEAAPKHKTDDPTTTSELLSWYKDAPPTKSMSEVNDDNAGIFMNKDSMDDMETSICLVRELKKQGDGARGQLLLHWEQGSGHSIVWEVDGRNVMFRDCQTNKTYKNAWDVYDILCHACEYEYVRTDNLEFSEEALRTIRPRKK